MNQNNPSVSISVILNQYQFDWVQKMIDAGHSSSQRDNCLIMLKT